MHRQDLAKNGNEGQLYLRPTACGTTFQAVESMVFLNSCGPFQTSSFLFLVVRPAPSSVLAPSSDARSP